MYFHDHIQMYFSYPPRRRPTTEPSHLNTAIFTVTASIQPKPTPSTTIPRFEPFTTYS